MIYYSIYNSLKKNNHTCQLLFCAVYGVASTCYSTLVLTVSSITERDAFPPRDRVSYESPMGDATEAGLRWLDSVYWSNKTELCLLTCCGLFYTKLVRWTVKIHPKCFYCKADWCVWLWVVFSPSIVWFRKNLFWFGLQAKISSQSLYRLPDTFNCSILALKSSHQMRNPWTKNCLP